MTTALENCPGVEIAIVIPTFNEAGNIALLVDRLSSLLKGRRWEVIFVDDNSSDGTADIVKAISRRFRPVRLLFRPKRRGLSSAVVEGMFATTADYVVVMDGDLQHDESIIPEMIRALETSDARLAIGSRHVRGGGGTEQMTVTRRRISDMSNSIARLALGRSIADLMSGFFAFRRDEIAPLATKINPTGFKILLDILFHLEADDRVVEVPYVFRQRMHGTSKLGIDVAAAFGIMIANKVLGRAISYRFLKFCVVGMLGVVVHLTLLWTLMNGSRLDFSIAQAIATLGAATSNFYLNNRWTYGELALHGRRWVSGLVIFLMISSVGMLANVGVATAVHNQNASWHLSALAGISIGVFWNYMMTKINVWRA